MLTRNRDGLAHQGGRLEEGRKIRKIRGVRGRHNASGNTMIGRANERLRDAGELPRERIDRYFESHGGRTDGVFNIF